MKTQMKFQKYICLVMLIMGALTLVYAFAYLSGGMAQLGQAKRAGDPGSGVQFQSAFQAVEGKNDYTLFEQIQPFNNLLMYCGIAMVLTAVLLYITACNTRRNYYISNYVAIGVCSLANIVLSVVLMAFNAGWKSKFLNVDFASWKAYNDYMVGIGGDSHYSESTLWFDLGFVVYTLMIVASILLILNLVWKVLLMKGEKQLLSGEIRGGAAV